MKANDFILKKTGLFLMIHCLYDFNLLSNDPTLFKSICVYNINGTDEKVSNIINRRGSLWIAHFISFHAKKQTTDQQNMCVSRWLLILNILSRRPGRCKTHIHRTGTRWLDCVYVNFLTTILLSDCFVKYYHWGNGFPDLYTPNCMWLNHYSQ